jgi:hypothetical protein
MELPQLEHYARTYRIKRGEGWDGEPAGPLASDASQMCDALYRFRTDADGRKIPIRKDGSDIQPMHIIGGTLEYSRPSALEPVGIWHRHFGWLVPLWRDFRDWCLKPVVMAAALYAAVFLVGFL